MTGPRSYYVKVVWREPPPLRKKGYFRSVEILSESPGRWALVRGFTNQAAACSLTSRLNKGDYGDHVEAVYRYQGGRRWNVYGRYVVEAAQ